MEERRMAGLLAAAALEQEELLSIIDRFDLRDFSTGVLIAPLWLHAHSPVSLIVDCTDPSPYFQPGSYILDALPHILLEGIKIAELILSPASLFLHLPDGTTVPPLLSGIPRQNEDSPKGLIHSAETFVSLARLFRREGADKRICKISATSLSDFYCELPITCSLQELVQQYSLQSLSGAQLGADPAHCIPSNQFHSTHPLGTHPCIHFY